MALFLEDFFQGDTYRIKIQYPIGTDLSGYIHTFTLKQVASDLTPALSVESTFGDSPLDYAGDAENPPLAFIVVSASLTDSVASGKYVYAVKALAPNQDEITLVPTPEHYKDKLWVAPKVPVEA